MATIEEAALAFLASALVQGTLLAASAAVCARLARLSPARQRHRLWLAALVLALLVPARAALDVAPRTAGLTSDAGLDARAVPPPSGAAPSLAAAPSAPGHRLPLSRPARNLLILCGALLPLMRAVALGRAWWRARAIRAGVEREALPPSIAPIAERCQNALGLGSVPILVSRRQATPVTVGAFHPVIILPHHLVDSASSEALTAVLGHEMAHIRRRDFALNLTCEILALPIAFHPAAAWLRRQIRQTREEACDDLVTAAVLDGRTYARALVTVARSLEARVGPAYAMGIFDDHSFEERVMRLVNTIPNPRPLRGRIWTAAASVMLALTAGVASGLAITVVEPDTPALSSPRGTVAHGVADVGDLAGPGESVSPPGAYAYHSASQRDPFLDLRTRPPRNDVHDPTGFLVQEIALRGVVKTRAGWTAMILGPDRRTYFVSVGQRFYDATLTSVDASGLTVQQRVRDPLAPPRARDLRLALHPGER